MKQYRRAYIGLFLSVSLFILSPNAQAESILLILPESIVLAMRNNPSMQIAQANIEKLRWGLEEAWDIISFMEGWTSGSLNTITQQRNIPA